MGTRYVALSYCWGKNPNHLLLTSQNIEDLCKGVEVSTLDKTFREAIEFTTRLGLEYIWIDALCILQRGEGCDEDWNRHVRLMQRNLFQLHSQPCGGSC
jgi:Heterokaryon incompatibility protein (HET)